jgi:hypothetical protein
MKLHDTITQVLTGVLTESTASTLDEAKDEYAIMKEVEKQLKEAVGHFANFHNGHEADALGEIRGILLHCTELTDKVKKML